jgi:uncharacterized protein YydD (DUF2326 family)
MSEVINKDEFLLWIQNEKQKVMDELQAKGKDLKSNPRKAEQVKTLDSIVNVLDQFLQEQKEGLNIKTFLDERRVFYRSKLDEYYRNDGKRAYELAKSLQAQGLAYRAIAHELTLAGIPTANGRTKWHDGSLYRMMKFLAQQEEKQ